MSSDELQIIETKKISDIKNCIIGMPDTGLTGMIGVTHLISSLSLEEIGYINSNLLPPVMVVHKGIPKQPIRLFGNKDLAAITSETPLNITSMYPLAKSIVNWVKSKGVDLLISISGVAVQNRMEIKNPFYKKMLFQLFGCNFLRSLKPNSLSNSARSIYTFVRARNNGFAPRVTNYRSRGRRRGGMLEFDLSRFPSSINVTKPSFRIALIKAWGEPYSSSLLSRRLIRACRNSTSMLLLFSKIG